MRSNRDRALDAAIDLLGTEGLRALTHARVDQRAGLPRGSTSNYFRTRAALLQGVVDAMVARESPAVDFAFAPHTTTELVDELCRLFDLMMGPNRVMTTARMTLLLEAGHDPGLRTTLVGGRRALEALVLPALARLGSPDPHAAFDTLTVCFEGLFMHRIAGHGDPDPRTVFDAVVRGTFHGDQLPTAVNLS